MKYLIVECRELGDQWECDADRTPICMTDDYSPYGSGYDVWEIQPDNTFKHIKKYDEANEEGMALYKWHQDADESEPPIVIKKFPGLKREDVDKAKARKIAKMAGFENAEEDMLPSVHCSGSYGEEVGDYWVVFGEYMDDHYDLGY